MTLAALLATAEPAQTSQGSGWFSLVFFGVIFAAMYLLLLRPQRKRLKDSQNLQASIAEGDEVVLNSGIYGFVTGIDEQDKNVLWLDIADGHDKERIEIRVSRGAVARRIEPAAAGE